jgi:hypothetical protein
MARVLVVLSLCRRTTLAAYRHLKYRIALYNTIPCVVASKVEVYYPSRLSVRGGDDVPAVDGSVEFAGSIHRTGHLCFEVSADGINMF